MWPGLDPERGAAVYRWVDEEGWVEPGHDREIWCVGVASRSSLEDAPQASVAFELDLLRPWSEAHAGTRDVQHTAYRLRRGNDEIGSEDRTLWLGHDVDD